MINDKQVNLWRGSSVPPTIYHVWLRNNTQMLIYNGTEWIVFVDDTTTIQKISELIDRVESVEQEISDINNYSVNSKLIKNNPVLNGEDLKLNKIGQFVTNNDTISDSIIKIDTLLNTQIIE